MISDFRDSFPFKTYCQILPRHRMSPASLVGLPSLAVSGEQWASLHYQALLEEEEAVVSWREVRSQGGDANLPRPICPVLGLAWRMDRQVLGVSLAPP